ncbi:MAG: hypothetical protein E7537_01870 [Ruminococcaceae bacterium]|nr:hypothetical protein [Oscillospiraceae bacterium]
MDIHSKFLSILISFSLLICTVFFNPVNADTQKMGYISKTSVNIRSDASTGSSVVENVSKIHVNIIGSKNDTANNKNPSTNKVYLWYKISFASSSKTVEGYVREDLIEIINVTVDSLFENKLKNFPKSYHKSLILLHSLYPNWTFTADKVPTGFSKTVNSFDNLFYKLVQTSHNSLRSMRKGCYDWNNKKFIETDSGGWYGASREVIAFYLDPRNFLNDTDIYQYLQQSYDKSSQNLAGVKDIVKDTFLDATISDKNDSYNGKHFAEVIIDAANSSGVNPYVLASIIIQEQGKNGSSLSDGVSYSGKKVYNFFNFGASGKNKTEVVNNGAKYAYNQGWTSRSSSIINGAKKYASDYIKEGQDTYFYKNYNILNPNKLWHQYAQNVADSRNSGKILKSVYSDQKNINVNFRIPVFNDLPDDISAYPPSNSKLNNYYFSDITASGLTPSFERYTYEYALSVKDSSVVKVTVPSGASFYGSKTVSLKKGQNTVKIAVTSQTGYSTTYTIDVEAKKKCNLVFSVTEEVGATASNGKVTLGDTNSDGKVTISDLANVRLHLLSIRKLKNNALIGADTNKDNKVTIIDLANIRLYLLGKIKLK